MSAAPEAGCRLLAWDSAFFGVRIARLADGALAPEEAACALDWCRRERVDCLYYLAEAADAASLALAREHGFRQVDVRVTLERELPGADPAAPSGLPVRPAAAGDLPALRALARGNHRQTRFYADGRFPRERCDELYATWIENSLRGQAEVLVGDWQGRLAGYVTALREEDGVAGIGLLGVAPEAAGRGWGGELVRQAVLRCRAGGAARMQVVTQGRNLAALRVYERAGFVRRPEQVWLHRWFEPA